MKIEFKELENRIHNNDGTWGVFYRNKEKYSGIVYDRFEGFLNWIFEVKEGKQHGLEKRYYEKSNILEEIAMYENGRKCGISKEFDEKGELNGISIMYNDEFLRCIEVKNGLGYEIESYNGQFKDILPAHVLSLLELSIEKLVEYQFPKENQLCL